MALLSSGNMYKQKKIVVIIPALNEEESLGSLLEQIPPYVDAVYVADNGSTDKSADVIFQARHNDPRIEYVFESRRGYGHACLAAMRTMRACDIVVFLDADGSDDPQQMPLLLDALIDQENDLVISNRFTAQRQKGSLSPPQIFGNKLAVFLIRLLWRFSYRDLGPFRAVTQPALEKVNLQDTNFGFTIELQIKAIEHGLKIAQVDVPYYQRRAGTSKVSGTLRGVIGAGYKIISIILKRRFSARAHR